MSSARHARHVLLVFGEPWEPYSVYFAAFWAQIAIAFLLAGVLQRALGDFVPDGLAIGYLGGFLQTRLP